MIYTRVWRKRIKHLQLLVESYLLAQVALGVILGILGILASPFWVFIGFAVVLHIRKIGFLIIFTLALCYFSIWSINLNNFLENTVGTYLDELIYVAEVYSTSRAQVFVADSRVGLVLAEAPLYPAIGKGDVIRFAERSQIVSTIEKFEGSFLDYLYSKGLNLFISTNEYALIKSNSNLSDKGFGAINRLLRSWLYPDQVGLVKGVLWGDDSEISRQKSDLFVRAGLSHLVAVSGFNVTILILLLSRLRGKLPRLVVTVLSIVVLVCYNYLVGLDNLPATRATIMGVAVLIGSVTGRPGSIWGSLTVSILLILIANPTALLNISFQLSVAALTGILLLYPRFATLLKFLPKVFSEGVGLTLAANLATLPITATSFGGYSIVSPITNLLVGPMVPILMLLSVASVLCGMLFPILAELLLYPVYLLTNMMFRLAELLTINDLSYTEDGLVIFVIACILILIVIASDYRLTIKR